MTGTRIPAARFRERRDRLRGQLGTAIGAERLVVASAPNVRYLTGFSGSNGVVVIDLDPDGDVLGTDGRYRDQVAMQSPDLPTIIDRDTLIATLDGIRPGTYAIEDTLSVGEATSLAARFRGQIVVSGAIESLRVTKDEDELAVLARACAITVDAFEALRSEIRVGVSERSLARRLEQLFGELGAEDRAFDSIVGSGPNSAIPHHEPGDRRLQPGDLVVIDAGARFDGYHADMTRTFLVDGGPAEWPEEIHRLVQASHLAGVQAVRPRATGRDVDAIARAVITSAGRGEQFTHGLGHGVGLEIHEAPNLGMRATATLGSSMAITVEPGVYVPGRGGVRIEDTLVVTDVGPRILTEAPRDLIVVG